MSQIKWNQRDCPEQSTNALFSFEKNGDPFTVSLAERDEKSHFLAWPVDGDLLTVLRARASGRNL